MTTAQGIEVVVTPSRTPKSEYVFLFVEKDGRSAHLYLTRAEAYDMGAELIGAADWLDHQASNTGREPTDG